MKKISYIILVALLFGCNPKNIDDCLKTKGDFISQEVEGLPFFDRLICNSRTKVFIESGPVQKVVIETGENLLSDVDVVVSDDTLLINNNNGCNILRDFERVRIFVTTPNLVSIRNGSGYALESIGVLDFPNLTLLSEDDSNEDEFNTDGDFILELDSETVTIVNNNISNYFLSGEVDSFDINIFQGDGRVDSPNLIAQDVKIYHRGSNKVIVNPQQSLSGELRSTGDLISVNHPPAVEVEELFTGRLIFQ